MEKNLKNSSIKNIEQKNINTFIKPGEIVHCNLTFLNKNKDIIIVRDTVFGRPYKGDIQTTYKIESSEDARSLIRYNIDEDCQLTEIDVIRSLGFKVHDAGYSKAIKNETDMTRQKSGGYN